MIHRLLLLRHGEVPSHRGDVPVTDRGLDRAETVGRRLAATADRIRVLTGETLRTRQTGAAIATGASAAGAAVDEPRVAFALRNPDLYVAGERVDMVSSPAALAEQVPGLTVDEAAAVPFFAAFFEQPDRIGWWLRLADVPGDDAEAVARRIGHFAASLPDRTTQPAQLTVGVTHSPVLRACALVHLGHDPGEPEWLTGLELSISSDRSVTVCWYAATD
ncbi:MAG TPA: phosphoglycerate mutase family protein [Actinomycetota bacterium]|nr:phosphoglycerate mutase family protein [Actinomycetota bacterium]